MALSTIAAAAVAEQTYQPLLLVTVAFPDASVLRLSSHPLNTSDGGYQYGGQDYYPRILRWNIGAIQAVAEQGLSVVPTVELTLADPDKWLWRNYEAASGKGFRGAVLGMTFVFWEADTATFSSDSKKKFSGICSGAKVDDRTMTISAENKLSLQKKQLPTVPIQRRCPWVFPKTAAAKALAGDKDSKYYPCGYTGVDTSCEYTPADCQSKSNWNRFGGSQWNPPKGGGSREYVSGDYLQILTNPNEARYGDFYPFVYGQAWVDAVQMPVVGDANSTRGEAVVCVGNVSQILRVAVNDVELPPATDMDGNSYYVQDSLMRWNIINRGDRDGSPNADTPYNSNGDPYGSLCAIMWVVPRSVADTASTPRVRVLVKGPRIRKVKHITSIVVSGGTATVTFVGRNADVASNDAGYAYTISGNSYGAINGDHTGLTNWGYGPPGTVEFSTGVGDGSGTGGYFIYEEFCDNPVWILLDILKRVGWSYSDIDTDSWITAADICDESVSYTNQNGDTASHERFRCSFVLRQRRSAADAVNGLLRSMNAILAPNNDTGLLEIYVKQTLAEQQPSTVTGSNYDTAVSSKDADGNAANGYVAYKFDDSTIRRLNDGRSTLKLSARSNNDTPNRVNFGFTNESRDWSGDSVSIIDEGGIERINQEVVKNVQVDGVPNLDQAKRVGRTMLSEGLYGNSQGDARGTVYGELEPVGGFRAVHLRVGQLCLLSETQHGITNQLIRIQSIKPGANFETCTIGFQFHDDDWYVDSYGQADDPEYAEQRRDHLPRPSFPWCPYKVQPAATDPMFDATDWNFRLEETHENAADGTSIAKLLITGRQPVNVFADLQPPLVGRQGTTANTGGALIGSGRVYYIAVCAKDSDGKLSPPSTLAEVAVTDTGTANTITAEVTGWDASAAGHVVFAGLSPHRLSFQQEAATTPTSVTITAYNERAWGMPDVEFDKLQVRVKRVEHAGVFGQPVDAVGTGTLTISSAGWTTDEWAGRDVSVIGIAAGGELAILNFSVVSNTSEVLTVTPDPAGGSPDLVSVGDALIMRSTPTVGSDSGGNYLSDAKWANDLSGAGTGLTPDEEIGRRLRIIAGTGRGDPPYRIKDNTETKVYIEGEWHTTPDATTRYIIEEPEWQVAKTTDTLDNSIASAEITITAEVTNYQQKTLLVQVRTVDGGGNESLPALSPVREIYVFGDSGVVGLAGNEGYKQNLVGSATYTPDLADGFTHEVYLDQDTEINPPIFTGGTLVAGARFYLVLVQDGTGGRAVTLDGDYSTAPNYDYNKDANSKTYIKFVLQPDLTTWYMGYFQL